MKGCKVDMMNPNYKHNTYHLQRYKRKWMMQFIQWLMAAILSALIINGFLFFYHRPTGWINRTKAATTAIWEPGTWCLMGTEGRGYHIVDSRGYLNAQLPLAEHYILVVGSSHTQAKEVRGGERYSDLLNKMIAVTEEELAVYNVSQDGLLLPGIVSGFYALTQEFPDAEAVIIEIGSTFFGTEELLAALNQREYDEAQRGENILAAMSLSGRMKLKIKEMTPLMTLIKSQIDILQNKKEAGMASDREDATLLDSFGGGQREALDLVLSCIRSEFDGMLVIVYHPAADITDEGLTIAALETDEIFQEVCEKNHILFVNTGDAFLEAYRNQYIVPYGFANTALGTGHLNRYGHQIVADELYKALTLTGEKTTWEKINREIITSEKIIREIITGEKINREMITRKKISREMIIEEKISEKKLTGKTISGSWTNVEARTGSGDGQ